MTDSPPPPADASQRPFLKRWYGPGILMAGIIGFLLSADVLVNGLMNHFAWWVPVSLLAAPWGLPFSSLIRQSWKEAALHAISLGAGTCIGLAGVWLVYARLNSRLPPHPFPHSLEDVAASNISIIDPIDPNSGDIDNSQQSRPVEDPDLPPKTQLALRKGIQNGIYTAVIRSNPNEPGSLFLRAFEQSSNSPLSEDPSDPKHQISKSTTHPARYSPNPEEIFTTSTDLKLMDGIWGQYYAARIEVWFAPSRGDTPRLLNSRVFKVEGWQR